MPNFHERLRVLERRQIEWRSCGKINKKKIRGNAGNEWKMEWEASNANVGNNFFSINSIILFACLLAMNDRNEIHGWSLFMKKWMNEVIEPTTKITYAVILLTSENNEFLDKFIFI